MESESASYILTKHNMLFEKKSSWFDGSILNPEQPVLTDYKYKALFGADFVITTRPSYVNLAEGVPVQNQWLKNVPSTAMGCNGYGFAHGSNCMNKYDDGGVYTEGNLLRKSFYESYKTEYEKSNINMLTQGSYKHDMLTHGKRENLITAYFFCSTLEEVLENLARGRAIHTGSKMIDYIAMRSKTEKIAVIGEGPAHIFAIVGYDDAKRLLICMNSWGVNATSMDKWFFYLRYEDFGTLYTSHALFDFDDAPVVEPAFALRDKIKAEMEEYISLKKPFTNRLKIGIQNRGLSATI